MRKADQVELLERRVEDLQAWGEQTRTYSKAELESGVNLAADFLDNSFSEPFAALNAKVAEKQ